MFIERYFENMNKNDCKKEQDNFQIKIGNFVKGRRTVDARLTHT